MSETLAESELPDQQVQPVSQPDGMPTVQIQIDKLIVGREVSFPIYGNDGVLLLAAGSAITSETKSRLKERGLVSVSLHEVDVAATTLQSSQGLEESYTVRLGSDLTKELDRVVDAGMLGARNTEGSVADSLLSHGTDSYDEPRHKQMFEEHAELCKNVDCMIKQVAEGGRVDVDDVRLVTASFLASMVDDSDSTLSVAFEACDDRALADHSLKTAMLAMAIGIESGFDATNVREVGITALVQDWGMSKVPAYIRETPGPLTEADILEIKKHPVHTLEMLEHVTGLSKATRLAAYQVHERPDGSGYPKGRKCQHIHQFARILQVADTYVAMTAPRPYRRPLIPYAAMECMLRQVNQHLLDRDAVRALLHTQSLFPIGTYVTLSNGFVAQVIRRSSTKYMTPVVQLKQDNKGQPIESVADANNLDLSSSKLKIVQALPTPGRHEIGFMPSLIHTATRLSL